MTLSTGHSTPLKMSPDEGDAADDAVLRVMIVDDDPAFVEAFSANLADSGFGVASFTDGARALPQLIGGDYDALVLDWYMPGVSGIAFLKQAREAGVTTPVIVLTGAAGESEEDIALAYGAADFVDKSRRVSILVRRLRLIAEGAKARRAAPSEMVVGPLSLRPRSCRALWNGREVELTITEFRVVEMLATRTGQDLSYREIYDVVHGEGFVAGDGESGYRVNVRSLIKRIRQKFCRIDAAFARIENYAGHGYRWQPEQVASGFDRALPEGLDRGAGESCGPMHRAHGSPHVTA